MRRVLFAQWGLGFSILLAAAAIGGCRRSDAAQAPPSKPPPETTGGHDVVIPIPPDPGILKVDEERRTVLLNMLTKGRLPLFLPTKIAESQDQAQRAFEKTFNSNYLPQDLRDKITIGKAGCGDFGCSVDVTYPDSDWATFTALDRVILDRKPNQPPSPFMSFPGARYRTGRVKIKGKTVASWILAFRVREPDESQRGHGKEGQ